MQTDLEELPQQVDPRISEQRTRLSRSVVTIYGRTTYLAHVLLQRPILVMGDDYTTKSKGETACTDGRTIWFNAPFAESLPQQELTYVLLHEGMHIAFLHCVQNLELLEKRGEHGVDWELLNWCRDAYINYYADEITRISGGDITPPASRITKEKVLEAYPDTPADFISTMTSIELHDLLRNQTPAKDWRNGAKPLVMLITSTDGEGKSLKEQKDALQKELHAVLVGAQIQSAHKRLPGEKPLGYEQVVNALLQPTPSLESFLRKHFQAGPGANSDWSRPPRTRAWMAGPGNPVIPRYRNTQTRRIVLAIDSSGSMSPSDMAHAVDVCARLLLESRKNHTKTELHVWSCDTNAHEIAKYTTYDKIPKELPLIGRGGTSFKPVFDKINENVRRGWNPKSTNLVYVTDSYGDAQNLKAPIIMPVWVIPPTVVSKTLEETLPYGPILTLSNGNTRIVRAK